MPVLKIHWMRSRTGTFAFVAAYLILRTLVSIASMHYAAGTGFSPWPVSSGLDVVFLLVCGWRWWPVPVLAAIARTALFPPELHATLPANSIAITLSVLVLALATMIAGERLHVRFPLRKPRDVGLFLGILGFAAPVVMAAIATGTLTAFGRFTLAQAPEQYGRLAIGLMTSIVVFVPSLALLLDWEEDADEAAAAGRRSGELLAGLIATVIVVGLEYAIGVRAGRPVLELSFVPLAYLAIRQGMRGAVLGVLAVDAASTLLHVAFSIPIVAQVEYQSYLIALALMAFLLGSVTQERDGFVARLHRRASVDELTELPNGDGLAAWIRRHQSRALVVVLLDIEDMRLLNEGVGRKSADALLREFASRLRDGLDTSCFVARVSSDEFAVATADARSPHSLIAEVRALLEAPFHVDGSRVFVAASAGAVRVARAGDVDELLRRADLALRRAKTSSNRTAVYTPELSGPSVPLLVVELHRAVERNELVPFFQPIYRYDAREGRWQLCGAEALLRWLHPERGLISPESFIDLLERLSIGDRVGWQVIEESLAAARVWRDRVPGFRVWVNLFARQALQEDCAQRIAGLLTRADVDPDALVVEVSEKTVVSEEREISSLVQQLRGLGVTTAIDDFGTGGSSLGRIREVPAHVLKIDRSFVTRCEVDAKAKAVAAAVVRLAGELGMETVAEGVENAPQVEAMVEIGCTFAQGYAMGHPVPAVLFDRLVAAAAEPDPV